MKLILLAVILLITTTSLSSQTYDGTIYLKNQKTIKTKAFILKNDVVKYKLRNNESVLEVSNDSISKIKVHNGSYAMAGITVGFLGSIIYLSGSGKVDSYEDFLLIYLAGGAIGGFIGAMFPKYYTINFTDNDEFTLLDGVKLMPDINKLNFTLINYSISF